MINATWITLAVVTVSGLTALLTYLLGDKRKIRILEGRKDALQKRLREALARNDTVAVSAISLELDGVRAQLRNFDRK